MPGPDYHGRTHKPYVGTDPIPVAGIHAHMTTDLTVGDNNDGALSFDTWVNDDPAVFGEETSGGKLTKIKLKFPGWYAVHAWVSWKTSWAGDAGIMMIHDDIGVNEVRMVQAQPRGVGLHLSETTTFQVVKYFPPVGLTDDPPFSTLFVDRLLFYVGQVSGASRDVDEAYAEVAYLAE